MFLKKIICSVLLIGLFIQAASAGISIVKSNGITLTGADGVQYFGANGLTMTGADGFLNYKSNGITLTGADGITLTGADGITLTGADGSTYTGTNGITLTGADGITLTGADGITLTGADGITLTGADGTVQYVNSMVVRQPNGITLTGADGITLTGADGFVQTSSDGITLTGADGITLTGADGITLTGADGIIGFRPDGSKLTMINPNGITLTGADGITLTGADGITLTGADGITLTGADTMPIQTIALSGLQSVDPELALLLNNATDDSNINAIIVYHQTPTESDLNQLRQIGILGGTRYRALPMIVVTATRNQLIAVSRLPQVRSLYGNRTLTFNSDPYFKNTGVQRVAPDGDLRLKNAGAAVSGRNVTVAVLDTGVNAMHNDLAGKVVQNVRLLDTLSLPLGFVNPTPIENLVNTDPISGHGTFVAGIVAASGAMSGGRYNGVASGANILGLSAGDLNLTHVLAGFDYVLERGANYNVRVINCSFSANTVFDYNDPVNVATKMLTEHGVNVVFSAGNTGPGNGTLNPYAAAPWVISVGATDERGRLASFSSRGNFGSSNQRPSLVAPGVNVVSLRSLITQTSVLGVALGADTQRLALTELPFYTTASGTSFSAPQVAGVIALMLEVNPNLTPAEIKDILQRSATPLPPFYSHEVGAGMLNAYAAVLEAAFPSRQTGLFRATLSQNVVTYKTLTAQIFNGTASPGSNHSTNITIPSNAVQSSVSIAWGGLTSLNDLGFRVFDSAGTFKGEANRLNLPGLTGKKEKIVFDKATLGNLRVEVRNTNGIGTAQNFIGALETTVADYQILVDLPRLSPQEQTIVLESLSSFVMLPEGKKFRFDSAVPRVELAAALVRGGRVQQFVAATPMFTDVSDITTRSIVESVQSNPGGKLIFDANTGGSFRPYDDATKLATAIALVKAANLESSVSTAILPLSVTDAYTIPSQWRGYVAVALQNGLMSLDGNAFKPTRSTTRLELAQAMVKLTKLAVQ